VSPRKKWIEVGEVEIPVQVGRSSTIFKKMYGNLKIIANHYPKKWDCTTIGIAEVLEVVEGRTLTISIRLRIKISPEHWGYAQDRFPRFSTTSFGYNTLKPQVSLVNKSPFIKAFAVTLKDTRLESKLQGFLQ